MKHLFSIRGVSAYLTVVFLNAFVDLGHKITVQNTIFKIYDGNTQIILTALVNGLILLPFILLFSPAGFIADRFQKNSIMRLSAWAAVIISALITFCYYQGYFVAAFAMTFLLAIQSAIYSPAKYGYIKGLFGKNNLGEANGLVQAITIVAILLGTFVFSILFESYYKPVNNDPTMLLQTIAPIGWMLLIGSIFELIMAYRLPALEQKFSNQGFKTTDYLTGKSAIKNIQPLIQNHVIRLSVIGLAIFWSVGQVMLAAFPAFAKETLAINSTVIIQGILAASGIGIAVGSALAARWSKGHIETGLIPIGALGIGTGLAILTSLDSALAHAMNFFFIGLMAGLFIVPLNALIQFNARSEDLGKVLAGNNLIQNIAMLGFLILTAAFALWDIESQHLLVLIAAVAIIGGAYTIYHLPQSLVRVLLNLVMTRRYRVHVDGLENLPEQGGVLLLGNHISWIDWAIVQIASPRPVRFVMAKNIYQQWYLKWFFDLFGVIPIEAGASSRKSLDTVALLLNEGEVVCLFPEGTISRTGHLAEFKQGFERACHQANDDVVIVPFYLRGLWGSRFSRSSEQLKAQSSSGLYRDLIVSFGKPVPKDSTADQVKHRVFDLSISSWEHHMEQAETIPALWINASKRAGQNMAVVDNLSAPLSNTKALAAGIAMSRRIQSLSKEQNIAILMPTTTGGVLANMAALMCGKTVVNLNFTASSSALTSALEQADITTVYSSKRFIEKLKRQGNDLTEFLANTRVIWLEELNAEISKAELIGTVIGVKLLPAFVLKTLFCKAKDNSQPATILFSSGSEGLPKGVVLSHRNIVANVKQTADVLNTQSDDVVMASLPLFHAFGLTITVMMPLLESIPMICHPDPTDTLNIAKSIAKYRATLLCGTSTFLRLYCKNRKVHPLMLESLRVVIAGAEKLNPTVRQDFQNKFGKNIVEGYGATETSPVASVNLPDALDTQYWRVQLGGKPGTVGMPLPGTSFKIINPETFEELATEEDGMILIGGSQVMQGYLNNPEKTREVIREIDGIRWYITGDKGHLDSDGFLTIVDRYSRFAKLGGEMVSLSAVETQVFTAAGDEELELIAINLPDDKKGEVIVLLTSKEIDLGELKKQMLDNGCNPLMIPSSAFAVESMPRLGSGKTDFKAAKLQAAKLIG